MPFVLRGLNLGHTTYEVNAFLKEFDNYKVDRLGIMHLPKSLIHINTRNTKKCDGCCYMKIHKVAYLPSQKSDNCKYSSVKTRPLHCFAFDSLTTLANVPEQPLTICTEL